LVMVHLLYRSGAKAKPSLTLPQGGEPHAQHQPGDKNHAQHTEGQALVARYRATYSIVATIGILGIFAAMVVDQPSWLNGMLRYGGYGLLALSFVIAFLTGRVKSNVESGRPE
jgi:hypothetical protein